MVGDLLRHFQLAAVLQVRRDPGRAEGMIANPRLDAGRFRPPADDAVGVLLEEGIGCKPTGLAAGSAEEIAVDVVGDAGSIDIIVQTLIETMGIRAEEKVDVELTKYAKKIIGKAKLLYKLAKAAMGQPDGVVKEVIYPVVGEKTLEDLICEAEAAEKHEHQVKSVTRGSYSHHYRRIVPALQLSKLTKIQLR